jgi:hypothetical protein
MTVTRELPDEQTADLLALTRQIADRELRPQAAAAERAGEYPRELIRTLGRAGLLGLPYPTEYGGGGVSYETYLQVLEELAGAWLTVALSISVHTLSCYPVAQFGTEEQRQLWLPDLIGGERLGAFCLSEPQAGSDAAALSTRAVLQDGAYVADGVKAWITHAGQADFYTLFVRTGADSTACLLADAATSGLLPQPPEHKMGLTASPTAQVVLDGARIPVDRRIGADGDGLRIALSALHGGRLGIGLPGRVVPARGSGHRDRGRPVPVPAGGPAAGCRPAVRPGGGDGEAVLHRHGHAGHHRRGAGARWRRLCRGPSGGTVDAGGEGHADLRGHQPGPADGDRPLIAYELTGPNRDGHRHTGVRTIHKGEFG